MQAHTVNFGDAMITYSDLCKAYEIRKKEDHDKSMQIRRIYQGLADAIASDLDLYGKTFQTEKESIHYVKYGIVEHGEFKVVDSQYSLPVFMPDGYKSNIYQLDGAIAVTLEISPNAFPKQTVFIRVTAELQGESLRFIFPDENNMTFEFVAQDRGMDFSSVVTAYKQMVMNVFK